MADYKSDIKTAEKKLQSYKADHERRALDASKAYINAIEKHISNEKGELDYSKLKNEDIQKNVSKDIVNELKNTYKKQLNIDLKDVNKDYVDTLFSSIFGFNENELKERISYEKDQFKLERLSQFATQNMSRFYQTQQNEALKDIKHKHLDDLLDYTGIDKSKIDKTEMSQQDIHQMIASYADQGKISNDWLEGEKFYIKPKKKEEKKK